MSDVDSVKYPLEAIHTSFLCRNFHLRNSDHGPDLIGIDGRRITSHRFELKTRNYARQQSGIQRPISDSSYWSPPLHQITRYEELASKEDLNLYWIFLLGQTNKPVSEIENLNGSHILQRDIYVVPWEICRAEDMNIKPSDSDLVHIGLSKIRKRYEFIERSINSRTRLYIAKTIEEAVSGFFV